MRPRLVILRGGDKGAEIPLPLGRNLTIGRAADADIRLDARYVSKYHCAVTFAQGLCVIEDTLSQNGTFVNQHRTTFAKLNHGDVIQVGQAALRFLWSAEPSAAETSADQWPDEAGPGRLELVVEGQVQAEFNLPTDRVLIVGRAAHADIWLPIKSVSRVHAILVHDGEVFVLSDALSENGSFVNGRRVECAELQDGDHIRLGKAELRIRYAPAGAEPAGSSLFSEETSSEIVVRPVRLPEELEAEPEEEPAPAGVDASQTAPLLDFRSAEKPSSGAPRRGEQVPDYKIKPENPEALRRDLVCTECGHRFVFAPYEGLRSLKCPRCGGVGVSLAFHYEWLAEQERKKRRRWQAAAAAAAAVIGLSAGLIWTLRSGQTAEMMVEEVVDEHGQPLGEELTALGDRRTAVRLRAIKRLVRQGEGAVEKLSRAMTANDRLVRLSATYALSRIPSPKASDALIRRVRRGDAETRCYVIDALESRKETKAAAAIMSVLDDPAPPVRAKAAEALAVIGDERAMPKLRRMVADPDTRTRRHAIKAMEKIGGQELFVTKRGGKIIIRPRRPSDPLPPSWMGTD